MRAWRSSKIRHLRPQTAELAAIERRKNPIYFMKYKSEFLKEQRKHSKEEYGPDCTVSNTKFSSVTLNELALLYT